MHGLTLSAVPVGMQSALLAIPVGMLLGGCLTSPPDFLDHNRILQDFLLLPLRLLHSPIPPLLLHSNLPLLPVGSMIARRQPERCLG